MQYPPLHTALSSLQDFVRQRLHNHFSNEEKQLEVFPEWGHSSLQHQLTPPETVVMLCALATHFVPDFFDKPIQEIFPKGGEFSEAGGVKGTNTRYTLPTGDTVLFLLAGTDAQKRSGYFKLFRTAHFFWTEKLLWLEEVKEGEPQWSSTLR